MLIVTAAVFGPWIARNYKVSGTLLGIQTYALLEDSPRFANHDLERSMEADPGNPLPLPIIKLKLMSNTRQIIQNDLPKIGGTYVSAFFLVGLLVGFFNPSVSRLRWFMLGALAVLIIAQALGRTQLSEDSPEINSENLLVLLSPLIVVYGVALFYVLLDQLDFAIPSLRYAAIGLFVAVGCLPMLMLFVTPKASPIAAQYRPDKIQRMTAWIKAEELTCSDEPWAVAWYGQRQCLWLPPKATHSKQETASTSDLTSINDYVKPLAAVYLTTQTGDSRFLSEFLRGGWGMIYWQAYLLSNAIEEAKRQNEGLSKTDQKPVPPAEVPIADFPLRKLAPGFADAAQIVLTDRERWPKPQP